MINTTDGLKAMTPAQIAYYTGKRVDSTKWIIPEGYGFCAITGKMLPESELLVTFAHHHFTREQRALLGAWGVGWCEDADWLSEEGYEVIMSRVEACGLMDVYQDGYWGPSPVAEPVIESVPTIEGAREPLPRVRTARKEEAAEIVARTKRYMQQDVLIITPVTPLVNLHSLVGATVQAAPMDDPVFRHETYIGTIDEVKLSKWGTHVRFQSDALVGKKWIRLEKVLGFAHFAETQKTAS